jgi:hypothetical protein
MKSYKKVDLGKPIYIRLVNQRVKLGNTICIQLEDQLDNQLYPQLYNNLASQLYLQLYNNLAIQLKIKKIYLDNQHKKV